MNSREPVRLLLNLLKTPKLVPTVMRAMTMKHVAAPVAYRFGDGQCPFSIQQVSIKITNACNLRCKTCGQWGETGYNLDRDRADLRQTIPVSRYLELVAELKRKRPIYYIWGGEPFLYSGLLELTGAIKAAGSILSVVTNGTYLEKFAESVSEQQWDALMFSLDGPEDVHDAIRGRAGTFAKVAAGIQAVREARQARHSRLPWIIALVTVSVDNAGRLEEIFATGQALGIDCMMVYYSWFTDEAVGNRHVRAMESCLNTTPTAWRGYLFNHDVDTEALRRSLASIQSRTWDFPYLMIPDLKPEELDTYYRDPSCSFGFGPCLSPWYVTELMPNGDVSPCRDYPDYIVGNILNEPLETIWHGARYTAFRKALIEAGGTFPICSRCCGLMGW